MGTDLFKLQYCVVVLKHLEDNFADTLSELCVIETFSEIRKLHYKQLL